MCTGRRHWKRKYLLFIIWLKNKMDNSRQPDPNSNFLKGKHYGSSPDSIELNYSIVTSNMSFIKGYVQ